MKISPLQYQSFSTRTLSLLCIFYDMLMDICDNYQEICEKIFAKKNNNAHNIKKRTNDDFGEYIVQILKYIFKETENKTFGTNYSSSGFDKLVETIKSLPNEYYNNNRIEAPISNLENNDLFTILDLYDKYQYNEEQGNICFSSLQINFFPLSSGEKHI